MKKKNNNTEKDIEINRLVKGFDKKKLNKLVDEITNKPLNDYIYESNVNHPSWYNHVEGIECIDVAKNFDFCIGNAIKYLWRAGRKHEGWEGTQEDLNKHIEDLKKAVWYINKEIEILNENGPSLTIYTSDSDK